MLETIKDRIEKYMLDNGLNTYNIRKSIKTGGKNPLGVGINTVNNLLKKDKIPTDKILKQLLNSIGVEYITNELGQIKEIL